MAVVRSVLAAIKARWDAQSVGDTVTGGLYSESAGKNRTPPYAVLSLVSSVRAGQASKAGGKLAQFEDTAVQVRLHHKGGESAALAVAEDTIRPALENAPLSVSGSDLLWCRYESTAVTTDPKHPNGVIVALTYTVQTETERTASPS